MGELWEIPAIHVLRRFHAQEPAGGTRPKPCNHAVFDAPRPHVHIHPQDCPRSVAAVHGDGGKTIIPVLHSATTYLILFLFMDY